MGELVNGNSYLLLPSSAEALGDKKSTVADANMTLQLTCIFQVDDSKVLGAFADETTLYNWAKTPTHYVAMRTKAILKMCEMNDIDKIVINSNSPDIFLVQHSSSK